MPVPGLGHPSHPSPQAPGLAAVNPDPDEAELNRAILEFAASTVDLYGGELHVAHAFELFAEHLMRSPTYGAMSDAEIDELRDEERATATET